MFKSNEDIETLKRQWRLDPIWDIEDTEGFEDYRGELKAYSDQCKMQWEEQAKKRHLKLAAKICPVMLYGRTQYGDGAHEYQHGGCLVEQCAWWSDAMGLCSAIVPGYLAGIETSRRERG